MPAPTILPKKSDMERSNPHRRLGFGVVMPEAEGKNKEATQRQYIGELLGKAKSTPTYCFEVLESYTITGQGPLSIQNVKELFSNQFSWLTSMQLSAVETTTTFVDPLKFQCATLVYATQIRLEGAPFIGVAPINSCSTLETTKPVSPYNFADRYGVAGVGDLIVDGALGLSQTSTAGASQMKRGFLNQGGWHDEFFYNLVRAYDMKWRHGQKFNIDVENLRHIASMPGSGQEGSASNSVWDVYTLLRPTNAYYQSGSGFAASTRNALAIDRKRTGNVQLAATPGGSVPGSTFSPNRDNQVMSITTGGFKTRTLLGGNTEFKRHPHAMLFAGGVAIGLDFQSNSGIYYSLMQNWMDVNHGLGATGVADMTESSIFTAGALASGVPTNNVTSVEPSLDASPNLNTTEVANDVELWKSCADPWSMTLSFKGNELTGECLRCFRDGGNLEWAKCNFGVVIDETVFDRY